MLEQHGYTPAEQIAAYAGHELQHGNEWDAAVLLALASYRYHQQAHLALEIGKSQSYMINPAMMEQYGEWVGHEVRVFNDQHFDDELDLLRQHLFGFAVAAKRRDTYLQELARGGREDAGFDQHLTALRDEMSNRQERLEYPALAEAFRARLLEDHSDDPKNSFAYYYLSATPLDEFRLAALDVTMAPFDGLLAHNLVPRLSTLRSQVRERLAHHRPYTRATAAAMLGLAPEPGDVALLEARLAKETNALVIDSLRFALIHHGKDEHLARLVHHAGQRTTQEERDHSLAMLLWLPLERKLTLDEALFVRLGRSEPGMSKEGRILALAMLRDLARGKALTQDSVTAALELTADAEERVAEMASDVVSALQQLGAAECRTLYQKYPRARAALLQRLGQKASLPDLDCLSHAYDQNRDDVEVQMAAAGAVAAIPGKASLQLLRRWLAAAGDHDDLRPFLMLVSLLATRTDAAQADLDRLDLPKAKRLMVQMAVNAGGLARSVTRIDGNASRNVTGYELGFQDAAQIAILSGLLPRPALAGMLWKLARYDNPRFYPADVVVRRHALGALVRMVLARRASGAERALAGR